MNRLAIGLSVCSLVWLVAAATTRAAAAVMKPLHGLWYPQTATQDNLKMASA